MYSRVWSVKCTVWSVNCAVSNAVKETELGIAQRRAAFVGVRSKRVCKGMRSDTEE